MDYVVGSVAALISGNVTPNRPKVLKRAITPIKHPPSPNVTPKSQIVDDRSIFLSPTLQKKKAIMKKSPKRIFQNPDLDVTDEAIVDSPKANKVKKHLNKDLTIDESTMETSIQTPKKKKKKLQVLEDESIALETSIGTPKKKKHKSQVLEEVDHLDSGNETLKENSLYEINLSPKKAKKTQKATINAMKNEQGKDHSNSGNKPINLENNQTSKKKKKKKRMQVNADHQDSDIAHLKDNLLDETVGNPIDGKTQKSETIITQKEQDEDNIKKNKISFEINIDISSKKKKKQKKSTKAVATTIENAKVPIESVTEIKSRKSKKNKGETYVNPNAITSKDSDSEHDSDNEIESETEKSNKEIMCNELAEETSDEEDQKETMVKQVEENVNVVNRVDELKRTLFIGNVPFNPKCKKDIKKIFRKYGNIESIRIRTVPVKDARTTPKLAVIKNEFHPERSTVNVYVKYSEESSVEQALAENNTVLNSCHLRVSKSDSTGEDHDPKCSIFVGNIPFALEDESFREKFEKCGEIDSVRIIRDKKTNAGKGFGYVNFKSKDGVELALAMSEEDLTIKNRILRVKRCTQVTQKHRFNNQKRHVNKHQERFNGTPSNRFTNKNVGQNEGQGGGASRRIANKRKNQENSTTGPPNKMQRTHSLVQPKKEKKSRKEFVGMTAEKKQKHKFSKDQKKKKQLSEILTK